MYRSVALALLVMTGTVGCVQPSGKMIPAEPDVLNVAFSCDNGEDLSVSFFQEQNLAILKRQGGSIELEQKPAASGFWYSNGPNSIRGKGDALTVEVGRMVPMQCRAR